MFQYPLDAVLTLPTYMYILKIKASIISPNSGHWVLATLDLTHHINSIAPWLGLYYVAKNIVIPPGPRLNIKTVLSTYGDFHVKDKTAVRTSYL